MLQRARALYDTLSAEGSPGGAPTDLVDEPARLDRDSMVAFAAIARFAKRNPAQYCLGGGPFEVLRMRMPPSDPGASVAAVRAQPGLSPVRVTSAVLGGVGKEGRCVCGAFAPLHEL